MSTSQRLSRTNSPEKKVKKVRTHSAEKPDFPISSCLFCPCFTVNPPSSSSHKKIGGDGKKVFSFPAQKTRVSLLYTSPIFFWRETFLGGKHSTSPNPNFSPWGKRKKNLPLVNQPPISTPPLPFLVRFGFFPVNQSGHEKKPTPFFILVCGGECVCVGGR